MRTAVILAGGQSRRMGRDKASLPFGGGTMLSHLIARYSGFFDRILVSVDRPGRFVLSGAEEVADVFPGDGPLAGLHAVFERTGAQTVFLTATDIPFSEPELALELLSMAEDYDACVIRRGNGHLEPLFGIYGRSCHPELLRCLENGQRSFQQLFERVRVRTVEERELADWNLDRVLANVNLPEDYGAARLLEIPVVSIVGFSGSGKTTFLEKLIPVLKSRGLRLGVIKHDAHSFEIDTPGKDTWRLTEAGADMVAISNSEKLAVIEKRASPPKLEDIIVRMKRVDLIITEGYKTGDKPKIEVHRRETGKPLFCSPSELLAVMTDEPLPIDVPQFSLDDAAGAADIIAQRLLST